ITSTSGPRVSARMPPDPALTPPNPCPNADISPDGRNIGFQPMELGRKIGATRNSGVQIRTPNFQLALIFHLILTVAPPPPRSAARRMRDDDGMIQTLPRAVPEPPGKPVREGASAGQERARRLALRPQTWDRREAVAMADVFDAAAVTWNES